MRLALMMVATWVFAVVLGGVWAALTVEGVEASAPAPTVQAEV